MNKRKIMTNNKTGIEVTKDWIDLLNAPYREQRLIGTLRGDGTKESFAAHHFFNDIGSRRLFKFETIEDLFEWES